MQTDSMMHHPKVEHLVFEAPDSVLGAYFVGQPSPLKVHTQDVDLSTVGVPQPHDSTFLAQFRQLWMPEIQEMTWQHESIPWQPSGIAGDPVDYQFRNDDYVTSVMLLSFFIMVWVIASSWKFLKGQINDFFYTRERANLFAEREDKVLRGRFFLVAQTCFLIALLFFAFSRTYLPDVFAQTSPYLLLGSATLIALFYYVVKIAVYNVVNHTFFAPVKCKHWNDIYLVSVLVTGCSLLPVVLLVVFFDVPFSLAALLCVLLLSVIKILLLYKCYRIFFNALLWSVHIILYFCALEIIPLGILAFSLVEVSHYLPMS